MATTARTASTSYGGVRRSRPAPSPAPTTGSTWSSAPDVGPGHDAADRGRHGRRRAAPRASRSAPTSPRPSTRRWTPATINGTTVRAARRGRPARPGARSPTTRPTAHSGPRSRRAALAYSTTYTATVKGGAGGVTDVAGNPLAADSRWSFTTGRAAAAAARRGPGRADPRDRLGSANPFSRYYAEILRAEGLNAFSGAPTSPPSTRPCSPSYDVVILGEMSLTRGQVTMLTDWVNGRRQPDRDAAGPSSSPACSA